MIATIKIATVDRPTKLPGWDTLLEDSEIVTTPGWYHYSFRIGLHCHAGEQYSIFVYRIDRGTTGMTSDQYAGGQAFDELVEWEPIDGDLSFRTYMDPDVPPATPATATPEPATPEPVVTAHPARGVSPSPSNRAASATPAVTAAPESPAGSTNGDSAGSTLPVAMAAIVLAGLLIIGLGFVLERRQRKRTVV